jgi:hypothetical protein
VIELELDQAGLVATSSKSGRFNSARRANTAKVHACAAKTASAKKDCALPAAKAYDHHDGKLRVQRVITRVRVDRNTKPVRVSKIDYSKRSEYVVEYDAKDASGNKADQVVFAVILDDTTKPVFKFNKPAYTVECKNRRRATVPMPFVSDNIDGTSVRSTLRVNGKKSQTVSIQRTKHSYTEKFTVNDFAGIFGKNGKNNQAAATRKFTVLDRKRPQIDSVKDVVFECGKKGAYKTPSPVCRDQCDGNKRVSVRRTIPKTAKKTWKLTYRCKDKAGRKDTEFQRVTIKDTTKPTIDFKLNYVLQESAGTKHKGFSGSIEKGFRHLGGHPDTTIAANQMKAFTCDDLCTGSCTGGKQLKRTHMWVQSCNNYKTARFNTLVPGTYYHKFTCTDCNGHKTAVCRTVINEDKHKPIINVLGSDHLTIEATHDENYVDAGATCSDHVDGVISQSVEVSGDVVNLVQPRTYTITYKCQDAAGNKADPMIRRVTVVDTTCPTCKVTGKKTIMREASFTYSDAGAVCTDSLNGPQRTVVRGKVNTESTGTYKITYSATDKAGNTNTGGKRCNKAQLEQVRTVIVKDTLKPVIALHFGGKKIHESTSNDKGLNKQRNPAGARFRAETSSVNGWLVGAIASAVAGVALLALGNKQTVTSVPV